MRAQNRFQNRNLLAVKSMALGLALGCAFAVVPSPAGAFNSFAGLTYNYSFPEMDLKKFIEKDSWYGLTLDLRRPIDSNRNLLVGISTGWYVFYDNVTTTIDLENGAITGEQYRNFNIIPILGGATLLLGQAGQARPYLGFNVGGYWVRQQLDIGLYSFTEDHWHFGLAPEAGIVFPMQRQDMKFYLNGRYHYLYEAGDYLGGFGLTLPFVTIGAGFAWSY